MTKQNLRKHDVSNFRDLFHDVGVLQYTVLCKRYLSQQLQLAFAVVHWPACDVHIIQLKMYQGQG